MLKNKLLMALPPGEYQRLIPYLKPVNLVLGQVIYEPYQLIKEVYFPNRAMISLVSMMKDGSTTEIGLVGNEGMVGIPVFLGGNVTTNRAIVQIEGNAMKMDADVLRGEFTRGEKLQKNLLLYTQARLTQVSQIAACKSHHLIEERFARWLLSVHDCVNQDELPLTQKFISEMLGVRRASVTEAAIALQKAELIKYSRGIITILKRKELEQAACECYSLIKNEFRRLLNDSPNS
ncbi:Crp/Fnr family transcriptional regulator [Plectonema cf. radiosum LEGE 06105]|uniref:Crp/Fnr family transcriptional regulator n=1 Tax=Plectonema cf. radiosum LEGE 06105 TaxID=945769 RepID=A0A8J7F4V7_9CYAN|nr:Crp/Fnr family transcriptional regulator [Plectonema radiosum]MBE9214308.1 Crp/Fnr family transcriptional regulator [Plectonema cf. radiosum LEGE 06105]